MKRFYLTVWGVIFTLHTFAQIRFDANIANNHLWRGIEVADGVVITSDISYTMLNGHICLGFWGGSNVTGEYKEFNHHLSFRTNGFSLSFWDTYNFSSGATYNNKEFFNYKASETGRFLDAIIDYRFKGYFPLYVSWSTILFGRDRNATNQANKYSSFCYIEYPVYAKKGWHLDAGIGTAFALNKAGDSSHFYGEQPGIVHISLKLSRKISIQGYKIPVHACAVWNPQANQAFWQIGAQLFSFN